MNNIPKEHRSFDARVIPATGRTGQSAILVRKSYWDANHAAAVSTEQAAGEPLAEFQARLDRVAASLAEIRAMRAKAEEQED